MPQWRERPEGGNRFWLLLIRWVILHIGRGFAQMCMWPTSLYFLLVRGAERRASQHWLQHVQAPRRGLPGTLIHIHTFAITIVDRVLMLSGRDQTLSVRAEGIDQLNLALAKGRGCLLLGSHLGSFEAIRAYSRQAPPEYRRLKVVMDRNQNSLMTQTLEAINPDIRETVINAHQSGPQIVLEVAEVLAQGGMVALLADRIYRQEASVDVEFLGQPAPFPVAPLAIAAALDAPVFLVFGLYEGSRRYRLVFEPLVRPGPLSRNRREKRAQLNQWVVAYAQRLEHYAKAYPYNWFNFYDFWNADRPDADRAEHHQPGPGQSRATAAKSGSDA